MLLANLVGLVLLATGGGLQLVSGDEFQAGPGVTAAQILKGRGFEVRESFVTTTKGNRLRATRGRNPRIEGGSLKAKLPILFVHGILAESSYFLVNSDGVTPKDLTGINATGSSLDSWRERLAEEPSAKSLPLLALNLGHEVWLLDRRGAAGSRELLGDPLSIPATTDNNEAQATQLAGSSSGQSLVGLANNILGVLSPASLISLAQQVPFTADARFWNYSLDEQARIDIPEVVDYVLNQTGHERLSLVGHSAGGAVALMALSLFPSDLQRKIASCVLWSPAYSLFHENSYLRILTAPVLPFAEAYLGPVPPTFASLPIQTALFLPCSNPILERTICESFLDLQFGSSGGKQPAKPELISSLFYSSSSHELAQLLQMTRYDTMSIRRYDFGQAGNQFAYGSPTPPAYDLSVLSPSFVSSRLSFYVGSTDSAVTPSDVKVTCSQLPAGGADSRLHVINTTFNHFGYISHVDTPKLAIIPSMYELEALAR